MKSVIGGNSGNLELLKKIDELNGKLTASITLEPGCTGSGTATKLNNIVFLHIDINETAIENQYSWKNKIATIPEGFRPKSDMTYMTAYDGQSVIVKIIVRSYGDISVWCGDSPGGSIACDVVYPVV